ncbi:hypothetical protein QFC21_003729 [Naganishia friedmannii]|uniref:Uncharacterized protein n=1 Tax=Naganishia friedmannii TaxID=89922 RepID=A0ACC2VNG9_9TREE|nr:hypothetical protein QFC21_003729 [Naganishia friedmannii]
MFGNNELDSGWILPDDHSAVDSTLGRLGLEDSNELLDSGWSLDNDHPGRNSTLGSLDLADNNNKGHHGMMLLEGEQQRGQDTYLSLADERNGGDIQLTAPANAAWHSSPFAMQFTNNNQFSSDAPKMEDILIDFGQVIALPPSADANTTLPSNMTSWETQSTSGAFGASIGWGVARGQSQRDGVPIGSRFHGNDIAINHATRAPPIYARSTFPPPFTSSNHLKPRIDSINTSRLPVALEAKPSRRRTSLASKAEQRATDLEDLTRRTAKTRISPSSARGIWDSLPIRFSNETETISNDNEYMPRASIPSDPSTVVEDFSAVTSVSEEQKKNNSVPSDRKLSTSMHAAAAVTPYKGRRGLQNPLGRTVRGKGEKGRDANSAGLTVGAVGKQAGNATSKHATSASADFANRVLSDGWTVGPALGGENKREQSSTRDVAYEQDWTKAENRLPGFLSTQALVGRPPVTLDQNNLTSSSAFTFGSPPAFKSKPDGNAAGWNLTNETSKADAWGGQQRVRPGTEKCQFESGVELPETSVTSQDIKGTVFIC